MNGPEFSPGNIVLIEHRPLDDPWATKVRPAIVISSSAFNTGNVDVIIAPISSSIRHGDLRQIVIHEHDADFGQTGLNQTSAIKCGAILAYPKRQIRRRLGQAPPALLSQIRQVLSEYLMQD